jgi:two-component system NarL family response regulator
MSDDKRPIRVLVAEDNFLTRFGTVMLLKTQADIEVVGEAADGARAVSMYRELQPDVMLLDLKMPVMHGVQVIASVLREAPAARILVLTFYDGDEDIFKAIKAGARGYLTKEVHGEQILAALRAVHAGERYMPAEIASRLADRMQQPSLTAREQDVLELMFKGRTNREIARDLELSEKTAGFYVGNILAKLGAKTRTEAVSIALQRGIISR